MSVNRDAAAHRHEPHRDFISFSHAFTVLHAATTDTGPSKVVSSWLCDRQGGQVLTLDRTCHGWPAATAQPQHWHNTPELKYSVAMVDL